MKLRNTAQIILGILIVAYIGFLLASQYRFQVKLNKTVLGQLKQEIENRSIAVGYFFSERKIDLKNLAADQVISVFFENRALGMSMEYGMRASLLAIEHRFKDIVKEKRIGGDRIYNRIVFINSDGKLLVDSCPAESGQRSIIDYTKLPSLKTPDPVIIAEKSEMAILIPYFFKGENRGRIIAWISHHRVKDHLIGNGISTDRFFGILSGDDNFYFSEEIPTGILNCGLGEIKRSEPGSFFSFYMDCYKKNRMEMVGVIVPVKETPFSLVKVVPVSKILGNFSPWHLLVALAALSVFFLSGSIFLWRTNTKNLVLHARIDESSKQKKAMEEKNIQLEVEISKRRNAEAKLKEYSFGLEKMVEKRTSELKKTLVDLQNAQSQLLQSEKLASIGQLAAGVAHEINNPVGFVKSNLGTMNEYRQDLTKLLESYETLESTLENDDDISGNAAVKDVIKNILGLKEEIDLEFITDDYQKVVEESMEGMDRVAKIVADLKDFSHVDKADLEHTDINKGIESTLNIVWNELKYKAKIIKDLDDIPLVKCYPQRLNQVFTNILVNAAQAIEEKGEINISTSANNGHVEIRISDTGSGIPPEVLPKIFDPFFTTKEVGKGTGLGLNMAYNIIEKHKGTIEVESEVGKGTTFIIHLQTEPDLTE